MSFDYEKLSKQITLQNYNILEQIIQKNPAFFPARYDYVKFKLLELELKKDENGKKCTKSDYTLIDSEEFSKISSMVLDHELGIIFIAHYYVKYNRPEKALKLLTNRNFSQKLQDNMNSDILSSYFLLKDYHSIKKHLKKIKKFELMTFCNASLHYSYFFDSIPDLTHATVNPFYGFEKPVLPIDYSKGNFFFNSSRKKVLFYCPDVNKNAVSLFLSFFDAPSTFQVYVLYNNPSSDYYTQLMKKTYNVNFLQSCDPMDNIEVIYNLRPDYFIDLIACGTHGLLDLSKHANQLGAVTVHGIGYPSNLNLTYPLYDYFITEPSIYKGPDAMSLKNFSCFRNYPDEELPIIKFQGFLTDARELLVGIPHRFIKMVRMIPILNKLPFRYLIKEEMSGDLIQGLNNFEVCEFYENHFDFYQFFNKVSFVIDSYPYSGTTCTCSSLFMGCPYIAIRGKSIVSKVAASIVEKINPDWVIEYNEKTIINDINAVAKLILNSYINREEIRAKFLSIMNHDEYVKDFYSTLIKLKKRI